jgi:hypothetical protein
MYNSDPEAGNIGQEEIDGQNELWSPNRFRNYPGHMMMMMMTMIYHHHHVCYVL